VPAEKNKGLTLISSFHRDDDEICALLGHYTTPRNISEERRSQQKIRNLYLSDSVFLTSKPEKIVHICTTIWKEISK
jgi:hypothetical protein